MRQRVLFAPRRHHTDIQRHQGRYPSGHTPPVDLYFLLMRCPYNFPGVDTLA
jgi:hypothetical protein